MGISLKAMEYFTTALRHGSIVKAAGELNIAASAVATAIDQVEAAFDLTLVTRQRSRGIEANASGRLVAEKLGRLLDEYHAVLSEAAELKQALSGPLRIGYYAPIAPAFLPSILASFVPQGSAVTLHLDECDNDSAQDGLLNGAYDAILFVSEDVRPSVEFDVLIEAPAYCLVPEDHPFATQGSVTMAQIADERLVVLNRPVAGAYYKALLDAQGKDLCIAAYATSTEMVRSLVSAGHGVAVLNMQPVTRQSYCGNTLSGVPISDALPPLTLSIGYQKSRPRRVVQHFVEACRTHFSSNGPHRCTVTPVPE
ncbi:LysR family transcriptional regulator [Cognatishimia sp. F0-27]|uniref:LysR family transcriptional regulator n=1 Tax=Cognatishimia sp. F0-27 TaxID=2816855 RepID=UPI001D0C3C9D|nr:LysR family transcriptional regulator [Cognatishimia sp. F0-27]MCC1493195.1 LysR family transcriptional regulator [Cognatishimia sp. F0-27]